MNEMPQDLELDFDAELEQDPEAPESSDAPEGQAPEPMPPIVRKLDPVELAGRFDTHFNALGFKPTVQELTIAQADLAAYLEKHAEALEQLHENASLYLSKMARLAPKDPHVKAMQERQQLLIDLQKAAGISED